MITVVLSFQMDHELERFQFLGNFCLGNNCPKFEKSSADDSNAMELQLICCQRPCELEEFEGDNQRTLKGARGAFAV